MTTTQLAKMQEGLRRANERRAAQQQEARRAFEAWLKDERQAYSRLILAQHEFGRGSEEFADASAHWREVLSRQARVGLPSDQAWA